MVSRRQHFSDILDSLLAELIFQRGPVGARRQIAAGPIQADDKAVPDDLQEFGARNRGNVANGSDVVLEDFRVATLGRAEKGKIDAAGSQEKDQREKQGSR